MPYLISSDYQPPRFFTNAHVQTIYATRIRQVKGVEYRRERIETPDGDFLDLDYSEVGIGPFAILIHGLEGNTKQRYMLGMVRALNMRGINTVSVNLRGCSGESNRLLRAYDMGSTRDLVLITYYLKHKYPHTDQYLVAFSLGGNLVLKFLGEAGNYAPPQIKRAVVFSVPCDLPSTAQMITAKSNRLYFYQFMHSVQKKLREKNRQFPGQVHPRALEWGHSFKHLDDYYTATLLGFNSAEEYWEKSSSKRVLAHIRVPTLLVNAKDDPLISPECFPHEVASESEFFSLETPEHGGHVGFVSFNASGEYWSERRASHFLLTGR